MQATETSVWSRAFERVRWIFLGGLSGVISGVVVLGLGARLVMYFSRLLHPNAVGRLTEGGNRIGEFTLEGTVGLVLFGGLLSGLMGAVVWVLAKDWLPNSWWVIGLAATAIGGPTLILSDNRDFTILADPALDIVLLLALVFAFGAAIPGIDRSLHRRLPSSDGSVARVIYSVLAAFGLLFVQLTFATFFSEFACFCSEPNILTGAALVVAGLASLVWWLLEARGADETPIWLRWAGRIGSWGAVAAGTFYLWREVTTIL